MKIKKLRLYFLIIITGTVILMGCEETPQKLFSKLERSHTGINFRNLLEETPDLNSLRYSYFYNGGGVAIGDINNDGLQDILFTGNMVKNRLYLNEGNFTFRDITQASGVAEKEGWCTGATMVDINGDGRLDIYICRSADGNSNRRKNLLFINKGDLTFSEEAEKYGLDEHGFSTQASFFDYDRDGDLDVVIINHSLKEYNTSIVENLKMRTKKNPNFSIKLYRNDEGHFTEVSEQAGITSNIITFGLNVAVSDLNGDGWPDFYVSNDFNEPDYLFINNGDGTFSEKIAAYLDQISIYSMGSDIADYNNDLLPDIYTLDMLPKDNKTQKMHSGAENFDKMQFLFNNGFYYQFTRNMLHKNNGNGSFSEIGQYAGVSNTDWSWAALFSDFDNDGFKDLFVTNGLVKDYTDMDFLQFTADEAIKSKRTGNEITMGELIERMPTNNLKNVMYKNMEGRRFEEANSDWGINELGVSNGAAYVDLDNDGFMDLVVNNSNEYATIYRNNGSANVKNNFLRIRLEGTSLNRMGIGAKVFLFCNNSKFFQEEIPVRGFQSSVDPVLNFGLGNNTLVDSILVIWPDLKIQKLEKIKSNQTLVIKHDDPASNNQYNVLPIDAPYLIGDSILQFEHIENEFNDFEVQSLMLNYLSRQGPCMAKADINGDGRSDLFIGGAKGKSGKIFLQNIAGKFIEKKSAALELDSLCEDVAAEFFDTNGDGFPDLYVGSGGFEFSENDPLLQDRLYLNDGKGNFSRKKDALPELLLSTGCVKAADINKDGYLDLFVGGRVIPGKYPNSPESRLLLNNGKGLFLDLTSRLAPNLQDLGMVTDAVWVDLNKDNYPDLIIVGEFMPIKVYINHKGENFVDQSENYIRFKSTGLWNRIYADDLDGDGDIDLLIGNQGLNQQFRASEKEPLQIFYKDFDKNGSIDPVFCYYIGGASYPAISRDDLIQQLPFLKKDFLTYGSYAEATTQSLFSLTELKDPQVLKAEMLSTIYLENKDTAGFILHTLPDEAQFAPVYAIGSMDINKDGKKDLLLFGNNSWTRIKFGQYTANHGIVLTGDGSGEFKYLPQWKSGLKIRGDVRSLQIITEKENPRLFLGINNSPIQSFRLK